MVLKACVRQILAHLSVVIFVEDTFFTKKTQKASLKPIYLQLTYEMHL